RRPPRERGRSAFPGGRRPGRADYRSPRDAGRRRRRGGSRGDATPAGGARGGVEGARRGGEASRPAARVLEPRQGVPIPPRQLPVRQGGLGDASLDAERRPPGGDRCLNTTARSASARSSPPSVSGGSMTTGGS